AFARGLESAGVIPVAKHFPGLGEASGNTDVAPAHTLPFASLQQAGLLPFERLIREGVPAIMVSNATVPGLSDTVPASLSGQVISGLLRAQLGFGGVVMTDSLEAGAITAYQPDLGKAAVQSLQAGSDMVMLAGTGPGQARTFDQVVQAITSAINSDALPRIFAEYSVRRILEMKGVPSACVSL
ncbi:MAG: glycoside hydrolase family 3 protein, partial [Actinomycetota bacterium]|nr:glycoside hydrolase family 3 protein [Actinomycetota bacterium]